MSESNDGGWFQSVPMTQGDYCSQRPLCMNKLASLALPGHSRSGRLYMLTREKTFKFKAEVGASGIAVQATKTRSFTTPLLSVAKLAFFLYLENGDSHYRVCGHRNNEGFSICVD